MNKKDLYKNGEYTKYFAPEKKTFPFAGVYEEKKRLILDRLSEGGKRILDIGGGRGRISLPLSHGNTVIMADLSIKMIEEAINKQAGGGTAEGGPGSIDYICCDAERPPFDAGSFDVILAIDLIPHIKNTQACMERLFALLKPGGTAVIDNSNSVPFWMFAYPEYVNWMSSPVKFIRTFFKGGILPNWADRIVHLKRNVFADYLRGAGFVIVDFIDLGPSYCPKWHLAFCRKPGV